MGACVPQGVQKVHWPPPFPQDPQLLTLPLCVGHSTRVAAPIVPPSLHTLPCPPSSPACQGVQEGQRTPSPLCSVAMAWLKMAELAKLSHLEPS